MCVWRPDAGGFCLRACGENDQMLMRAGGARASVARLSGARALPLVPPTEWLTAFERPPSQSTPSQQPQQRHRRHVGCVFLEVPVISKAHSPYACHGPQLLPAIAHTEAPMGDCQFLGNCTLSG